MLWQTVRHNQESVMQVLLDNGIDVNMIPYSGLHALDIAAAQGHEQMVRSHVHLSEGPDLSPIEHATTNGHQRIVGLLLQLGANVDNAVISSTRSGQALTLPTEVPGNSNPLYIFWA